MSDDVVWQLIKNGFCSFRKTSDTKSFCTNVYNVTGLCNHASCPLANSNYATVIEDQGNLMLCLKTVERCHLPREQWEKIKLPTNTRQGMREIAERTKVGFSTHLTNKCKLRFKRLKEVLSNMRRIALDRKVKVTPVKKKTERRELIREKKAEIAAKLDKSIEQELLNRLNQGIYGELYNFASEEAVEEEPKEEEAEKEPAPKRKRRRVNIEYEKDDDVMQLQYN